MIESCPGNRSLTPLCAEIWYQHRYVYIYPSIYLSIYISIYISIYALPQNPPRAHRAENCQQMPDGLSLIVLVNPLNAHEIAEDMVIEQANHLAVSIG